MSTVCEGPSHRKLEGQVAQASGDSQSQRYADKAEKVQSLHIKLMSKYQTTSPEVYYEFNFLEILRISYLRAQLLRGLLWAYMYFNYIHLSKATFKI